MEIECKDGWIVLRYPKTLLVLSRAPFVEALKRGKAYQRRAALAARQLPTLPPKGMINIDQTA